jgi:hypothetical protein
MKAIDFEKYFWATENIRIVLRVDPNTEVGDYSYKNAANEIWTITELGGKRITKCIGDVPYNIMALRQIEWVGGRMLRSSCTLNRS